ncbi:MAG: glycosyltransferase [Rhodoglobus sp.]
MSQLREGIFNRLILLSRLQVLVFRALTAVVDAGSPAIRFGFGHAVRRRLLERSLVSLVAAEGEASEELRSASASEQPREDVSQPLVALVTRTLGTGGVEAIVASLAQGLPEHGLDCIVLCELGGSTADALRALGITVVEARDEASAISALADAGSVVAAQLHNAPDHLIAACAVRGIPIVQVVHTTDINLSAEHWLQQSDLHDRSAAIVAVSETVKEFLEFHLPRRPSVPVVVVPNGVAAREWSDRHFARQRLGDAIGVQLGETAVVACLARYDIQKNIPGLVHAFLLAASSGSDARLIIAGPVGDWLEYAHADAIRRAHPLAGRVHLLGSSWSAGILDAADAFVLDSFFEGWPVAASEAVMAGIPLVISDVGGARELVGETATRGVICHNPGSEPSTITRAQIRSARTRSVQSNRDELATALHDICQNITQWRLRRERLAGDAAQWLSADTMVAAHARLLHGVRAAADEASSKAPEERR